MKKNENGRSMIEMLGVLAIIGVLSVGGIYGYTVAMRKYRANEIVQTMSMLAVAAKSADGGTGDCLTLSKSGLDTTVAGITVEMVADASVGGNPEVYVQIKNLTPDETDELCHAIETIAPSDDSIAGYTCGDCSSNAPSCEEP